MIKRSIERNVVAHLREHLPGAKWSRPEGRHLTLKFLGSVPDESVEPIVQSLSEAAAPLRPFRAAFDTLGGFPSFRRPRVLWLGIGKGADELMTLAGAVERVLAPLGFPGEDRPFRAHFTLARFPKPATVGELPDVELPRRSFAVDELVLFRSQLQPRGARYTALERFPLT